MQLTVKQEEALKIAIERYKMGMPYTVIAGYAGVGKSTLVKFIVAALGLDSDEIAYIAYTGKAATVLKNKGCPNAMTAHKLLYYAKQNPNGTYTFKPKPALEGDYKLIVVDEISMLPNELWERLLSHHVHVLAMGDPGQLPPVKGEASDILQHPHIFLDEVMRQAQESAIIRLSMHIREGKDFRTFPTVSGEVRIVQHTWEFPDEDTALCQASQVICGTNDQRNKLNYRIRKLYGRGDVPEVGDKIIALHNYWEDISIQGNPLTNGVIGSITKKNNYIQEYPHIEKFKKLKPTEIMETDIYSEDDDDIFTELPIDYQELLTGTPSLTGEDEYKLSGHNKMLLAKQNRNAYYSAAAYLKVVPYHFAYGYAITCWKAQGSEFPYVLGYDCPWLKRKSKEEYIKYLYTLVTRAQNAVILVGD